MYLCNSIYVSYIYAILFLVGQLTFQQLHKIIWFLFSIFLNFNQRSFFFLLLQSWPHQECIMLDAADTRRLRGLVAIQVLGYHSQGHKQRKSIPKVARTCQKTEKYQIPKTLKCWKWRLSSNITTVVLDQKWNSSIPAGYSSTCFRHFTVLHRSCLSCLHRHRNGKAPRCLQELWSVHRGILSLPWIVTKTSPFSFSIYCFSAICRY